MKYNCLLSVMCLYVSVFSSEQAELEDFKTINFQIICTWIMQKQLTAESY